MQTNATSHHLHSLEPEQWVKRYGNELYRFAFQRVRDTADAQDLVQDVFVAAWRAREGFRGEVSERNWLYTILKRKIIDRARRQRPFVALDAEGSIEDALFDEGGHWRRDVGPRWNADELTPVERSEFREILDACLDTMPEQQRIAFSMLYIDEDEPAAICQLLELKTSTYWVILHRARHRMRACMERKWFTRTGKG